MSRPDIEAMRTAIQPFIDHELMTMPFSPRSLAALLYYIELLEGRLRSVESSLENDAPAELILEALRAPEED